MRGIYQWSHKGHYCINYFHIKTSLWCWPAGGIMILFRNHFMYVPSQWETPLHCNVVSHWLGAYTLWSSQQWMLIVVNSLSAAIKDCNRGTAQNCLDYCFRVTHWPPGLSSWLIISKLINMSWACHVKLPLGECHKMSLMISQHWFR